MLDGWRAEWPSTEGLRESIPAESWQRAHRGLWLLAVTVVLSAGVASLILSPIGRMPLSGGTEWMALIGSIVVPLAIVALAFSGWLLASEPWEAMRAAALRRFARQRGLVFAEYAGPTSRRGVFFGERGGDSADPGSPRSSSGVSAYDHRLVMWRSASGDVPVFRLGIARASADAVGRGPIKRFRYLMVRLPRPVPHLVLDSARNGRLRGLGRAQRISLEGDADRHFTVYAPEGYGRDAREVLTPDVLAAVIDHGPDWDVELVDDQLIVVSRRTSWRSDRDETTALTRAAELMVASFARQAGHYSDDRAAPGAHVVARSGRRLVVAWRFEAALGFLALAAAAAAPWLLSAWLA